MHVKLVTGVSAEAIGVTFLFSWSNFVCIPLTVLLPVSLVAQESSAAMLRSTGVGVYVNESAAPASIAVFPNDLIKTQRDVAARIEATGSSADINSETVVQFQSDELALDHGSVTVNTTRGMRVRVGCITVTPVHDNQRTNYQVLDVNGKVTVSAQKDDVYIEAHARNTESIKEREKNRSIVHEGEQKSREEKCGGGYSRAEVAATGGPLDSPYAIAAGAGAVAAIACLGLCHNDDPISPAKPQ